MSETSTGEAPATNAEMEAAYARNWIGGVLECLIQQQQISPDEARLFDDLGGSVDIAVNENKASSQFEQASRAVSVLSDLEQAVGSKVDASMASGVDHQDPGASANQMRLDQLRNLAALMQGSRQSELEE